MSTPTYMTTASSRSQPTGADVFDVAVVGAGPAGATAARELAAAGIRVALVERAALPRYKSCAGGIPVRTAALLPFNPGGTPPPVYTALLPLLGLMGLTLGRRRGKAVRLRLGLMLASMVLLLVVVGCGGGGRPVLPTPAGTYTVTVTATSATTGDSGTATITLTVP